MVEMLGTSFDHSDKAQLEPLVEYVEASWCRATEEHGFIPHEYR
ncbi:hypothetical protein [Adlercreutzia sp. ZJ141]|nr:hypothetical protein [Adlercreutzia sp. ZJ141]